MPEISRFMGIVISMYHNDHGAPHFHARYGEFKISVNIASGAVHGHFPRRKQALVLAWARAHRRELIDNGARLRARLPALPIAPME
jgi:hypothetical protein